jgi:RNA binding exosome subunit
MTGRASEMIKRVEITAFCYPTEDMAKVKQAFSTISPKEPTVFHTTTHFNSDMFILTSVLENKSDIKKFVDVLKQLTVEDKNLLLNTLDSRVDEEGHLYLRFDKFAALDGDVKLADNGESITAAIKFVTYPFNLAKVIDEIKSLFGE